MTTSTRFVAGGSRSSIRRLVARYRLPESHVDERRRLDRVIASALSTVLEAAMERAGVPVTEEICVRALHIVSRVRLDTRDEDLALEWSLAVADAVAHEIRNGGPDVIRYASRHQALCDLALSAARGDGARVWAWRQLGLWSGPETSSRAVLAAGAIEALAGEAHAAAPVLAEVARRRGLLLLATHAPSEHWVALAKSAVEAMGGEGGMVFVRDEQMTEGASATRHDTSEAIVRSSAVSIERVVRASAIISAMRGSAATLPATTLRALATLALLETTPEHAMSRAPDVTRTIDAVETAIRERVAPSPSGTRHARAEEESSRPKQRAFHSPREGSATAVAVRPTTSAGDEYAIADVRQHATTLAGGLLFLLHLVRDTELVERIVDDDPLLGARGLAWSLHQLAMALGDIEASDPAALAFCGHRPGDDPPSGDAQPATADELEAVHACRTVIVGALVERLATTDPPERVLAAVVRRRAIIVADPGWIEARFTLDEVSVPVRRAGLDLDPDWLPWLGVVVRFVYG